MINSNVTKQLIGNTTDFIIDKSNTIQKEHHDEHHDNHFESPCNIDTQVAISWIFIIFLLSLLAIRLPYTVNQGWCVIFIRKK